MFEDGTLTRHRCKWGMGDVFLRLLLAFLAPVSLAACLFTRDNPQDQRRCNAECSDGSVCLGGTCVDLDTSWKTIMPSTFEMGSPMEESCRIFDEQQISVTLTNKFEIQSTEVTQDQFYAVMGYKPSYFTFTLCEGTCPVETVSWHEAAAYCNSLSSKAGLQVCYKCSGLDANVRCQETTVFAGGMGIYACNGYRLPTEAEWEYAYRAGTKTAYYNGANDQSLCSSCSVKDTHADKIGWYCGNSDYRTHPVGTKMANAWGLYDMAGNVAEWCHDGYHTKIGASGVSDSQVWRGGSWYSIPRLIRAAFRGSESPTSRDSHIGFRCARSIP